MRFIFRLRIFALLMAFSSCVRIHPLQLKPVTFTIPNPDLSKFDLDFSSGGQPGQITAMGAVIATDDKPNSSLTVIAEAGIGKDGTRPKLAEGFRPKFKLNLELSDTAKKDLLDIANKNDLFTLGCSSEIVEEIVGQRKPTIVEAKISDGTRVITANTVILCGKIESNYFLDSIIADRIVFINLNLSSADWTLGFNIKSNSLTVKGQNTITTRARDSKSSSLTFAGDISLEITKAFNASTGNLLLASHGANYSATKK